MANKLLTCETCPKMILESSILTRQTSKGPMRICKTCAEEYDKSLTSDILTASSSIANSTAIEKPEVTAYLQQVSPVTNPQEVPHPISGKKFTQSQLFAEYLQDEQLKISALFDASIEGYEPHLAYASLEARIALIESIVFEAKTRGSELTKKKRELDALSGKNRWDKERRGENKTNLTDPRDKHYDARKGKDKRTTLTKVEGMVKGMLDIGTSDDEIITMMSASGKFKGIEIREAIEKFKKGL